MSNDDDFNIFTGMLDPSRSMGGVVPGLKKHRTIGPCFGGEMGEETWSPYGCGGLKSNCKVDSLKDALKDCISAMNMQEGRELEDLEIPQKTAKMIWDLAKKKGINALYGRKEKGMKKAKGVVKKPFIMREPSDSGVPRRLKKWVRSFVDKVKHNEKGATGIGWSTQDQFLFFHDVDIIQLEEFVSFTLARYLSDHRSYAEDGGSAVADYLSNKD